jgi:iron(III) transport system substrate-binding protein
MVRMTWVGLVALGLAACGGTAQAPTSTAASASPVVAKPASSTAAGSSAAAQPAASGSSAAIDALYQQAKAEGQVVWNSSQQDSIFLPVVEAFKKAYPGINVAYSQAGADSVAKIQVQQAAKKVEVDVANVAELNLADVVNGKMPMAIDWAKLDVPTERVIENAVIYFHSPNGVVIYNTQAVPASDAPKTWNDLLDPKWMGKEALDGKGSFVTAIAQSQGEAQGLDFATKLAANKPLFQGSSTQAEALGISGQALIGTDVAGNVIAAQKKGAPVEMAPVSPIHANANFTFVPAGAPHAAAGQLAIAWMSSPDGQAAMDASGNAVLGKDCNTPPQSAGSRFLCSRNVSWNMYTDFKQFQPIADYTTKVQQAFGTTTAK